MSHLNESNMQSNSSSFDGKKLCKLWERKMEELISLFVFQQRLDSKKKMEDSQKPKNMSLMCCFQQANNHRKRIFNFYKTDLASSQSIKNFLTHTWKMQKYKIYTADFNNMIHSSSAWLTMQSALISWQQACFCREEWRDDWWERCCLHHSDVEHWLRRVASSLNVVSLIKKVILKCMILQYDNMQQNIRFFQ